MVEIPLSVVGTSVPRSDAVAKVTGRAKFGADYSVPGMLWAAVVRSTRPHAKILSIDTTDADKMSGVETIVTFKDIPGNNVVPVIFRDQPCLASDRVRYVGEPIALVAADSLETSREAANQVYITYQDIPAVFDPLEARKPNAPKVYGDDNIVKHWKIKRGDVEHAFTHAHIVIEDIYRTPYQEHAYIEPQAMLTIPTSNGGIEVFGAMQCPFYVQWALVEVLGLPYSKVRVIQSATGGAFGGKEDVPSLVACQAALLAMESKRPVKLVYSRQEDILSMSKRHPAWIRYKSAADKDGHLLAVEVEYVLNAGAYATLSPVVLWRGTVHAVGPYRCDNVKVDAYAVATNTVPCGAFRGFGSPQILFASESQMDRLADALGIDPAEFRARNLLKKGDTTYFGQTLKSSVGAEECLNRALESTQFSEKRNQYLAKLNHSKLRRGIGMACTFYGVGLGAGGAYMARCGAFVQMLADGSVQFAVGTTEMGQGMETVLGQIVAEELGVSYDKVTILPTDTSRIPDSGPTVASRATTMSGQALRNACAPIRDILLQEAMEYLKVPIAEINLRKGIAIAGKQQVEISQLAATAIKKRKCLAAQGFHLAPPTTWDAETGHGDAYFVYSWATHIAEVEVNIHTGEVKVLKITAAHDVGKAVNPQTVEGQIEGGAVQGMGFALTEQIPIENGVLQALDFSTYIIPTAMDVPEIQSIIVEHPFPEGPYGAKGFGEHPLMGIAPAIANAVANAMGIRLTELPLIPERVLDTFSPLRSRGD
jgi:CO/xanthine dehydrogenase Mo-binding subunit